LGDRGGDAVTQRADLFAAASVDGGVLDLARFNRFAGGWTWVSEFGTPADATSLRTLVAVSPLHNAQTPGHYPAVLVSANEHDDIVPPLHSYKFAAALQSGQNGPKPELLRVEPDAGLDAAMPANKRSAREADASLSVERLANAPLNQSFLNMGVLAGYATFVDYVKTALLGAGALLAVVCALDWAVRSRRISPFSGVARFFRARIDPMMAPVERVIVRSGGVPTAAPWWSLVALVLFGILLISLLPIRLRHFVAGDVCVQHALDDRHHARVVGLRDPPTRPPRSRHIVVASISPSSRWIRWSYVLTNWMIAPLQRVIPRIGMIDITPIVAWILLNVIQGVFSIP
jgi:uncharacterized protein YggT (Ycf19 family)